MCSPTTLIANRIALIALNVVLAGCLTAHAQQTQPTTTQPAIDRSGWPDKLRFGLVPTEGGGDVVATFDPLIKHLQSVLRLPIESSSATAYNGIITAMGNKQLDIAYFGPKSYVEAANRAGAEALALELDQFGKPGYYSIIIAKSSTGWKTLDDARGRRFAFTDPNSTSGYLVPRILFIRDRGGDPEKFFSEIKFSGAHGTSILQVAKGDIDAAATNTLDFARVISKGGPREDEFVTLWKSDMIPGCPIAGRKDLPTSLKHAITDALVSFKNDSADSNFQSRGYIRTSDEQYDIIRYLIDKERELKK